LAIAESIEKNNAGRPYDRLDLAASINQSPNSSGFRQLIISSGRYGLTEGGYMADKIALTTLGGSIVAPTAETRAAGGIRQALLMPEILRKVFERFDKKAIPREDLFKNTLRKEFNVSPEDVDQCYEIIVANMEDHNLIQSIKGNEFLQLDRLSEALPTDEPPLSDIAISSGVEDTSLETQRSLPLPIKPTVFISQSKNAKILGQLKQMLEFGDFAFEVAVERETTAIPIPEKIFGLMRHCNCAVINVSADEQEKHESEYGINQNVLIEIGAAFLQYNRRVILLVDKRVHLPSNLQGLSVLYYEGDELSWETGMKLQKALTEFRTNL
jgi:hypothetical protein